MSTLSKIQVWLEANLPALLAEHKVPAAAVAVYSDGEVIDVASGVLSKATGVEANTDSLFQVGSITKVWTTTLVMQLVDDGLVELDAPVRTYLPEFRIADEAAAAAITVRQLLCHTSGFEGDIFTDTGQGTDSIEKYVPTLSETPQLFAPGAMFSYNNAAFALLGRLIEVLRGQTFDECLRERLFTPLGLTHAAANAWEAILYRAAVGHIVADPGDDPQAAPVWALPRSTAAAGAMLAMRPRDLVAFARMHLDDGVAADGTTVLSAAGVKAMQERQIELPYLGRMGEAWGLGWEIFDWPGGPVIGHDGGTIGQSAFLRLLPGHNLAVALLTNGGNVIAVYTAIFEHIFRELAGVEVPAFPTPPDGARVVDASRYVGTYASSVGDNIVTQDDAGRVWIEQIPKGILAEIGEPATKAEVVTLTGDTLVSTEPLRGLYQPFAFVGDDGAGHAQYLHTGRADRRVGA